MSMRRPVFPVFVVWGVGVAFDLNVVRAANAVMSNTNPLSTPVPWDLVAEGYEAELVPVFEHFGRAIRARSGIDLALEQGRMVEVVDVACGPGTFVGLLPHGRVRVSAIDFSPVMVARLKARFPQVEAVVGDGQALPYDDGGFDHAVSMFGLIFFPDRAKGFSELYRVLRPGGVAAVSSWVSAERSRGLAVLFAALRPIFGAVAEPSTDPAPRMGLSEPEDYHREMGAAGFVDIDVVEVAHMVRYTNTDAMLSHFERASAPVAMAKQALGDRWLSMRDLVLSSLAAELGTGPQELAMPALVGCGRKPSA